MKLLRILFISLVLSGCAGHGWIKKYDIINGKKVLVSMTVAKGRNVKMETEDGAKLETKSWTMPPLLLR
ncbi:MAG TPA: hypothetical protein ENH82_00425 [bacterium]|nr:hypothetical protein [bacterium]